MDCAEARDHLHDLNRGRLADGSAEAVRVHVGTCVACAEALRVDAEVRALLRAEVPRYAAPLALRARIQALLTVSAPTDRAPARPMGWRAWLLGHRWTVGSLTGALAAILLVWAGALWLARDPVARLVDRAVAEHMEYVKETMTWPAADPPALVRQLKDRVGFSFGAIFPGDSQEHLVAGRVSDLSGKRAATFIYRDIVGRYTTLFLMPEAGIVIPSEGRTPIETFKPYHRVVAGRQLFLWTQGDLACLLVSDLDQAGSASMFLKIRKMT
jgi:anti-sigma factor (TIGR02949 family)